MKLNFSHLTLVLSLALAVACNKDDNGAASRAFSYNGNTYATLQEAVDALVRGTGNGETANIVMENDYSGPGAAVVPEFLGYLGLDLAGHRCELTTPLDAVFSQMLLTGSGSFAGDIKSQNSFIGISGDADISGRLILSCDFGEYAPLEDNGCFEPGFSGSFKGDIVLDRAMLSIYSTKGRFDINKLDVKGKEGMFNVTSGLENAVEVSVASVSDGGHVCCCDGKDLKVVSGEKPHVHNFSLSEEVGGSCATPISIKHTCPDCGYAVFESSEDRFRPCNADFLIHVEPKLASAGSGGNVEYWQCPFCGKMYADAAATLPLLGSPTVLADNYLQDPALLHSLDDVFDWHTEFEKETKDAIAVAGIVLSVLGILETAGLSIPGLVADDGPKWAEVNAKLDQILQTLERIETKIDALAQKVDAVAYKQLIVDRNTKFNFLNTKSTPVFKLITDYARSNDALKAEKIAAALKDWCANEFGGTNIADLTQSLMQQYVKTGLDANVPAMFGHIANCSYLWEHDGYNFRYQAMAQDVMLTGISYLMTGNYISSVKEYNNEDLRKLDLDKLKSDFAAYEKAVKNELDNIKDRNGKYRRYNPSNMTFDIAVKSYNFRKWFENHRDYGFPRLNQNGTAVSSCNKVLSDLGLDKDLGLTSAMAKEIYNYYNRKNTNKVSIYAILRDSVGFTGGPAKFDPGIIFVNNTGGFGHENGDNAIPVYRIFHWESYRGSNYHDYFGIRSCLHDDCSEKNHNFLYNCDISSYSSGHINSLGSATGWSWYTLVKSAEQ